MKKTLLSPTFCETSETRETVYEKADSRPAFGCESCVTFVSRVTNTFRRDLKRLRNRFCIEKERATSELFRMFRKIEHRAFLNEMKGLSREIGRKAPEFPVP